MKRHAVATLLSGLTNKVIACWVDTRGTPAVPLPRPQHVLSRYVPAFARKAWILCGFVACVMLILWIGARSMRKEYEASALVELDARQAGSDQTLYFASQVRLAQSDQVFQIAAGGNTHQPQEWLPGLAVSHDPESNLLSFTYRSPDAQVACSRAEAMAFAYSIYSLAKRFQTELDDYNLARLGREKALRSELADAKARRASTGSILECAAFAKEVPAAGLAQEPAPDMFRKVLESEYSLSLAREALAGHELADTLAKAERVTSVGLELRPLIYNVSPTEASYQRLVKKVESLSTEFGLPYSPPKFAAPATDVRLVRGRIADSLFLASLILGFVVVSATFLAYFATGTTNERHRNT